MSRVSLIVPTLNAENELPALLDAVVSQTRVPEEILVVDSTSDDRTVCVAQSYKGVETVVIPRDEFDHGGTREMAFNRTGGDFVLFLTQDAVPANESYISNLLSAFDDSKIGMVTGRQIPKPTARRYVQLVQEFNYPDHSNVRSASDIERMGIRAFFASDACSAYRRSSLEMINGIPHPCATNEDMLAAARLLRAGYKVAYEAGAQVIHSHNLTPREQFDRNYAVGRFLEEFSEELDIPSEIGEGGKLVKQVTSQLLHEGLVGELFAFGIDCGARLLGNRAGKRAARRACLSASAMGER